MKRSNPTRIMYQIKALLRQNMELEKKGTIEAKQKIARNETIIYKMNERLNKYRSTGEGWQNFLAQ